MPASTDVAWTELTDSSRAAFEYAAGCSLGHATRPKEVAPRANVALPPVVSESLLIAPDVPADLGPLFGDPEVARVVGFSTGGPLTEQPVRECSGTPLG